MHFAGGNAYSFRFLTPHLQEFDIIPLELPGRGNRMHEELIRDFNLAAGDLYNQILLKGVTPDFIIYGHSMGAYLGLRVANMLEKAGFPPLCLLVSGNPGPGIREKKARHLLGHDDFIGELTRLGGIPNEILQNEELFTLFEPILRADFEIVEKADLLDEPAVSVPLFAMMGSHEEDMDKITNWKKYTNSAFAYEIMKGHHCFIYKNAPRLADVITQHYLKNKLYC